jgi:hypothetical protein
MEYQFDRSRCGSCAHANRPPKIWPIFEYCPYCGRDLSTKNKKENEDMERVTWTDEMDETIRMMTKDGKSDAEICEALGIESKQLKNRLYNLKVKERAGEDDHTIETNQQETEIRPRELNRYELELVDMIEERERQITAMEKRWEETDLENRRLTVKLRKAESLILKLVDELYGEG